MLREPTQAKRPSSNLSKVNPGNAWFIAAFSAIRSPGSFSYHWATANLPLGITIEDESSSRPEDEIEKVDAKKELELALKKLPERERTLLVFYYHENMTLKEIGDAINISESRVSQLHAQAIMKLKNLLSENRSERLKKSIV